MLKRICKQNKLRNNTDNEENQYLNLIEDILNENNEFIGRNGKTLSIFGSCMHFTLENNKVPFLTTKKLAWKTCLRELLWFINGSTSNDILNNQNVHIWDGNSNRKFLDERGLTNNREGDLGPVYGFQWRHFNADYIDCDTDYNNKGIDQLQLIIDQLKNPETRNSRRLIMTAWNPCQINNMALPPCHILCQFNVTDNKKLSCSLYQRSGDVGLGVPFNIASYSLLTHIIAKHTDLEAFEFIYYLGNTHIYDDHIEGLKQQIYREPYNFPDLEINNKYDKIEDYKIEDFVISNYNYHETIKLNMRE
jgi:thymidylate synthase